MNVYKQNQSNPIVLKKNLHDIDRYKRLWAELIVQTCLRDNKIVEILDCICYFFKNVEIVPTFEVRFPVCEDARHPRIEL